MIEKKTHEDEWPIGSHGNLYYFKIGAHCKMYIAIQL